ncbi:MAG TPA: ornithine cyclodeaminase family protein [Candidatus Acidoferrales bacterium]|nr:ornithine cyclodeaminase family protein [Candidatus Acidoferrales bacterium]
MPVLLTEGDVRSLLTMELALEAVEESFRRLADGAGLVQPRRRLNVPGKSYLHYMAAADSAAGYMGMKIYTTSRQGLRFLIPLFDANSGDSLALIEADYLGQIRTGAASGVATKFLAREDASRVGVIGTGSQAKTQLEAVAAVRKIREIRAYGRDAARREKFAKEMTAQLGARVMPVDSAEAAARGAAIVITATTSTRPVLEGAWLAAGAHINAIGANFPQKRELNDEAVRLCERIVVDSREQSKMEAGDLIDTLRDDDSGWGRVLDLSEIVAGKVKGRTGADQITLFKSSGIASEDIAVAGRIYELARERRVGKQIDMWGE